MHRCSCFNHVNRGLIETVKFLCSASLAGYLFKVCGVSQSRGLDITLKVCVCVGGGGGGGGGGVKFMLFFEDLYLSKLKKVGNHFKLELVCLI